MPILDFHTHAFPDGLAPKAIASLEAGIDWRAETDGTVADLLRHMDAQGVDQAVVANIATKPAQAAPILNWCHQIASDRIIPFASVHPFSPTVSEELEAIIQAGIRGIKIHPMYQQFEADDPAVFPLYEAVRAAGLVVLAHAGYDIAFGPLSTAAPSRFARVLDAFPGLKLVLAHLGGWNAFEEFAQTLLGRDVYIDTALCMDYCPPEVLHRILKNHSQDRILFGTDSPWGKIADQIEYVRNFLISDTAREKIFSGNARALLSL
ncbi:MAG TPA: amidohydrolase family protein [Candidatus Sumerlaeota bacterium]|nr:amidohydrolase family protein [Candidatus Sumerlaeota bacterium]